MATDWFAEKTSQIAPGAIEAFGIMLISRYDKADEMCEMLEFAELIVRWGVGLCVPSVLYDSKACICTVNLQENLAAEAIDLIRRAGILTLAQFVLVDAGDGESVYHGRARLEAVEVLEHVLRHGGPVEFDRSDMERLMAILLDDEGHYEADAVWDVAERVNKMILLRATPAVGHA